MRYKTLKTNGITLTIIYINNHHWKSDHFGYTPNNGYECESGGFLEIISWLRSFDFSIGNGTRLVTDTVNRYLANRWGSPQWTYLSTKYYAVIHHHTSNSQRRLKNTIMAWSVIQGIYDLYNSTEKQWMKDLLEGYSTFDPAWKLLMSNSGLYDSTTNMFRIVSNQDPSNSATALGVTLMFFIGIVPVNATLAVPIEELHYEYTYNMFDPELYQFNYTACKVRISIKNVTDGGYVKFIFGNQSCGYTFTSTGVYELTFSYDFNQITQVTKISDLPENRVYLPFDTTPPSPSNINTSSNHAGASCIFSVKWTDNMELEEYIFGTNNTGHWVNETYTWSDGLTTAWSNVTKTLNNTEKTIQWQIWACDTAGNWNSTGLQTLNLVTGLSVGWNNFTAWSVDVGHTLLEVNVSLHVDNINFTVVTFHYSNGTEISLVWIQTTNEYYVENTTMTVTSDTTIWIYCKEEGEWHHTYGS